MHVAPSRAPLRNPAPYSSALSDVHDGHDVLGPSDRSSSRQSAQVNSDDSASGVWQTVRPQPEGVTNRLRSAAEKRTTEADIALAKARKRAEESYASVKDGATKLTWSVKEQLAALRGGPNRGQFGASRPYV